VELPSWIVVEVGHWCCLQQHFGTALMVVVSALSVRTVRRLELIENSHESLPTFAAGSNIRPQAQNAADSHDSRGNRAEGL